MQRAHDVTIVLVDTDDEPVAPFTLDAVWLAVDGITAEVLVAEARTTPGRAWVGDPRIRVIHADPSDSPTRVRNLCITRTDAPVVAFVGAMAALDPGAVRAAINAMAAGPDIVAVSGAGVEVGEPTLSLCGNVGVRHPLDDRRVHEVLYPVPEMAFFRRAAVDDGSRFAEDLSWPCAVIELSWRLRSAGKRVVLDPAVRFTGPCTCLADAYSGLVLLHTCLSEDSLEHLLPAAMLAVAERDGAGAIDRFVERSPELMLRRSAAQMMATGTDSPERHVLGILEPPRADQTLRDAYSEVVRRTGLDARFERRVRILVITPDILLARMAGPAIRAWQIAQTLAARHEVHLASTASVCELSSHRFSISAGDELELELRASWAEVIILQGFAMEGRPYLADEAKVLVVDLYDPLHLEQLELFRDAAENHRRITVRGATRVLNEQLVRGDFFVCASPKQKDFWLGQMAGLGRVNHIVYDEDVRLHNLIDVVPFGLPDDPPSRTGPGVKGAVPGIGADDRVILWGGGIYNWFDPLTLIRAVAALKDRVPEVRLFFMGLRHPNPDVTEMRVATEARRLAKELKLTDRWVFFNDGWVPYGDRQNFLLDADVGVSTHFDHVETQFSFRTRILDYIWCGLPIVATDGDWFADLIVREDLGLVVPATDVDALEHALFRMLEEPGLAASCRDALLDVRSQFAWERVLGPIVSFCARPRRAPDLVDGEMRSSLWAPDVVRRAEWAQEQPGIADRVRSVIANL